MQSYTNIEDNLESFNVITYETVSEYGWLSQLIKNGSIVANNQLLAQYCDITHNNPSGTLFEKEFPDGSSQYYDISYMEMPHGFDGQYIKGHKLEGSLNDPHILNNQYATVTLKDYPWLQLPSHNHHTWFPMSEKAITEFKGLVEKHDTYFFKIIDNAGEDNFVNLRHATMSDKQQMMMHSIQALDSKIHEKQTASHPSLKQIKNDIASISDTFAVMTDHVKYRVPYHITNGTIESIEPHCKLSSLVIQINPAGNGQMILEIPRELLDKGAGNKVVGENNDFFVLLDGEEIEYEENKYDNTREIMIQFVLDSKELEIIGPLLYPEYGVDACKIVHNPPYSYILPPLKQYDMGVVFQEIQCKEGLELVGKMSSADPACVKEQSIPKLVQRGWTKNHDNDYMNDDDFPQKFRSFSEFEGKITHGLDLEKTTFKVGETIKIKPYLVSTHNDKIQIEHSRPIFLVSVYDKDDDNVLNRPYLIETVGILATLEPKKAHYWDSEFIDEFYEIKINKPGIYWVVSEANFLIKSEPSEQYTIESDEVTINIVS